MAVTAKQVKELRDRTGVGMMDAKKALVEVDGDMDKAIDLLREKGMAKAAKKADRIAAEGLTGIFVEGNIAAVVEVNSETDFVAKNDQFVALVNETAEVIAKNKPANNEEALKLTMSNGKTMEEAYIEATTVIGEKIDFRRFEIVEKSDSEVFGAYKHGGGLIGVITVVEGGEEKLAKDLAMHIAAMKPQVLSYKDLDPNFIEQEVVALKARLEIENEDRKRTGKPFLTIPEYGSELQLTSEVLVKVEEGLKEELKAQGKPEKIWDKILPGQLDRFVRDNTQIDQQYTLLAQPYVLDDSKTVAKFLESVNASIRMFVRFEVGEGIEKKEDNFVEEVMAQANMNK
ncbi:elongation factor Ts [Pilibacter termitis]|uniref:Elongation factor Ts n=1 Tax=Pilibacter termitis TaxID=263852 RepID=A0A1T4Q0C7_9ENTE|nr:translation elongation factor Ts [Pilibacter termitis]SJZ97026.1 elongation factor Ts [Pilibacter termitis]